MFLIDDQINDITEQLVEGQTYLRELYEARDGGLKLVLINMEDSSLKVYDIEKEKRLRARKWLLQDPRWWGRRF